MIFRAFATSLTVAGVVALGIGPVRVALDRNPAEIGTSPPVPLVLTDEPGLDPVWAPGLVDSRTRTPLGRAARVAKPERIDLDTALADVADPGTLSVVGPAEGQDLAGVGVVVAGDEARTLLALPEPDRARAVGTLVRPDEAGLAVFAVGAAPRDALVIDRFSGPGRRTRLQQADEDVAELVAGWAQVRPDLRALVNRGRAAGADLPEASEPGGGGAAAAGDAQPGTRRWDAVVARAVREEILPAVDAGRAAISPHLLHGADRLVELEDGSVTLTARGTAYAVAARAIQPGSRLLPTRGPEDLEARVLTRPDGRIAVLAWNDGATRALVVQVPEGDRVLRYELSLRGRALTAVVLPR